MLDKYDVLTLRWPLKQEKKTPEASLGVPEG